MSPYIYIYIYIYMYVYVFILRQACLLLELQHLLQIFFCISNSIFFFWSGLWLLKACVCYFLSKFYIFIKWWTFKNYEKCFLFHLQSSFRSQEIQIFVIFSLPLHTFKIQKGKWKWNNLWCHKLTRINLQMLSLE